MCNVQHICVSADQSHANRVCVLCVFYVCVYVCMCTLVPTNYLYCCISHIPDIVILLSFKEKQTRIDQYETECNFMSTEVNELKLRLEGFQKSVEHGGRSEGNSILEALKAEVHIMNSYRYIGI